MYSVESLRTGTVYSGVTEDRDIVQCGVTLASTQPELSMLGMKNSFPSWLLCTKTVYFLRVPTAAPDAEFFNATLATF